MQTADDGGALKSPAELLHDSTYKTLNFLQERYGMSAGSGGGSPNLEVTANFGKEPEQSAVKRTASTRSTNADTPGAPDASNCDAAIGDAKNLDFTMAVASSTAADPDVADGGYPTNSSAEAAGKPVELLARLSIDPKDETLLWSPSTEVTPRAEGGAGQEPEAAAEVRIPEPDAALEPFRIRRLRFENGVSSSSSSQKEETPRSRVSPSGSSCSGSARSGAAVSRPARKPEPRTVACAANEDEGLLAASSSVPPTAPAAPGLQRTAGEALAAKVGGAAEAVRNSFSPQNVIESLGSALSWLDDTQREGHARSMHSSEESKESQDDEESKDSGGDEEHKDSEQNVQPAHQAETPAKWHEAAEGPGVYIVLHENAAITMGVVAAPPVLRRLKKGTLITVTKVQHCPDEKRVRGLVEDPLGWVSLIDTTDGYRWARKQTPGTGEAPHDDAHAKQQAGSNRTAPPLFAGEQQKHCSSPEPREQQQPVLTLGTGSVLPQPTLTAREHPWNLVPSAEQDPAVVQAAVVHKAASPEPRMEGTAESESATADLTKVTLDSQVAMLNLLTQRGAPADPDTAVNHSSRGGAHWFLHKGSESTAGSADCRSPEEADLFVPALGTLDKASKPTMLGTTASREQQDAEMDGDVVSDERLKELARAALLAACRNPAATSIRPDDPLAVTFSSAGKSGRAPHGQGSSSGSRDVHFLGKRSECADAAAPPPTSTTPRATITIEPREGESVGAVCRKPRAKAVAAVSRSSRSSVAGVARPRADHHAGTSSHSSGGSGGTATSVST